MNTRNTVRFGLVVGLALLATPPLATAQPSGTPSPPPYVPGVVLPFPGSYNYQYNVIPVGPPAVVDARGVRVSTNAAGGQHLRGMPGSRLGNSGQGPSSLTNASAQSGVAVGNTKPEAPSPGISIAAGPQTSVEVGATGGETPESALDVAPGLPALDPTLPPMSLGDPYGRPPGPATSGAP